MLDFGRRYNSDFTTQLKHTPQGPFVADADSSGFSVELGRDVPLHLDCGADLGPFTVAYQTYGELNADKSNAVLVCHALSGDQFVASTHPVTGKPGWWHILIGPGRPLDPAHHHIICTNVLGGCMGTTGPSSIEAATSEPYGVNFPVITIADMVRAQALL